MPAQSMAAGLPATAKESRIAAPPVALSESPAPPGNTPPIVATRQLGMDFADGTSALRDVTVQVQRGEFVSVVGPSGCGKSTLLRILAGLLKPTSGEVAGVGDHATSMVFQDPTLMPWRTVQRNAELLLELNGMGRAERKERARDALAKVGLTGFERARPHQLSGGMRMRLSFARSLALGPELFLMDEPFSALDALTRERLNDHLADLSFRDSFAAVLVTHHIGEAAFLSDRIIVMSNRPARVIGEVHVPLPEKRSPELRSEATYLRCLDAVRELLATEDGIG